MSEPITEPPEQPAVSPDMPDTTTEEPAASTAEASPDPVEEEPAEPEAEPDHTGPPWLNYRYVGHDGGRVYAEVPVTVVPGDVICWHSSPGLDWEITDEPVNKMPDNYRPEPEPADDESGPAEQQPLEGGVNGG